MAVRATRTVTYDIWFKDEVPENVANGTSDPDQVEAELSFGAASNITHVSTEVTKDVEPPVSEEDDFINQLARAFGIDPDSLNDDFDDQESDEEDNEDVPEDPAE